MEYLCTHRPQLSIRLPTALSSPTLPADWPYFFLASDLSSVSRRWAMSFAAKAKGVYKGRPVTFDRARIVALRKEGMGATEIAKAVGCKRGNVYKALKAAGLN